MTKKAFTMVELILVIVIIGVILLFALPNVTSTLEKNKKDRMIEDAKDMVEKAKNYILTGKEVYPINDENCTSKIFLYNLDPREEIIDSPFGGEYNRTNSYVKICKSNNSYIYTVNLEDDKYKLNSDISDLNTNEKYEKISKK